MQAIMIAYTTKIMISVVLLFLRMSLNTEDPLFILRLSSY